MKKYKNYFTLALFLMGTLILLLYILKWHAVYQEQVFNKPIIGQYVKEIKLEEFDDYIKDNRDCVVYFGITSNEDDRKFETKVKDYIVEYHLQEAITYLNVNLLVEEFKELMEIQYYKSVLKDEKPFLNDVPALAVFKDAKLVAFITGSNLTIKNIISLLKEYEIIDIEDVND